MTSGKLIAGKSQADLVRYVTNQFLAEGRDLSVKEIAIGMQCSEATVRGLLQQAHGCPSQLRCDRIGKATHEKNYGQERGSVMVWVYGPNREHLRNLLNTARRTDGDEASCENPC